MGNVKLLYELQNLELRIEKIKEEISFLSGESEKEKKFKELIKKIEEDKKFLENKQKEIRLLNIDLQANLDKQKSHKVKSSRITNPKELSKLEKEIEYLKGKQTQIEDKILELMEEIENKNKELKENEKLLVLEEIEVKKEKEEREKNIKILEEELKAKSQELEKLLPVIDEEILEIYKNLKEEKNKIVVAEVLEGTCSGCSITITTSQLSKVKNSNEMVFCENCGRILYYKNLK
jgi:predicted  nucleic acid-binding Zn-ribbon protein